MSIQDRKKEHVELTVYKDVLYQKSNGFEKYRFNHSALPEVNYDEVSLSGEFLGRTFSFPLFISSMTGGYAKGGAVNAQIAKFCEEQNLPFGVGSQRIMLEKPEEMESFSIVREFAPTAFIASNIGGAQLIDPIGDRALSLLTESIRADAVIVHLNPLQELMQPEGDRNFKGVLQGIKHLVESVELPVIVKETGAGITANVAEQLLATGVRVIDVAGAGGTSWAKVENLRERSVDAMKGFNEWGVPTAELVEEVSALKGRFSFDLISSGGVYSMFDLVKSLALGADVVGMAQPIIKALVTGGVGELEQKLKDWKREVKTILTLLGCPTIRDLNRSHLR
ncbi:MAG TPA: type 2 isopentenyl-diphosphate Delta-isomerase [Balneolaceae bacterium]|nr:type 2 isopentenyl-diphosphate Delta-isomerase [Balneolaceae bacterium]